jgi:F-type H+-transporting ATPase subunit epsilon
MKEFKLELITPEGTVFKGMIQSVIIPGVDGLFQVLYQHAPLIAALGNGTVTIQTPEYQTIQYQISGGVSEVLNNQVIILAEKIIKE